MQIIYEDSSISKGLKISSRVQSICSLLSDAKFQGSTWKEIFRFITGQDTMGTDLNDDEFYEISEISIEPGFKGIKTEVE